MHDARHSGTATVRGPRKGTVRWKRDLGANVTPGTVIAADGSVLVATNGGVLYALDPQTGATRWSFDGGGGYGTDLSTSAAVLADGTIAWPGPRDTLFGIGPDGALRWKLDVGGTVLSPAVSASGRIYAVTMSGGVSAIDVGATSATIAWKLDVGGATYASPSIGPDGTIYTSSDHDAVAVTDGGNEGRIRWRFKVDDLIEVSPAVASDGTLVVGTNGPLTWGVHPDGTKAWATRRDAETYSSVVVTPGGKAYYGDHSATLYVTDATTGAIVRRTTTKAAVGGRSWGIWTAPAVDVDGAAYYGTRSGHVFGVGPAGEVLFDIDIGGTVDSYPALDGDGTLYIGSSNSTFIAVGPA